MKALEKDRTRRYETANGFAADVLRHLAYEPVLAAPPSRAYRLRKFVRKHRGAVIAAGLVLLALLAGIAAVAACRRRPTPGWPESLKRETNAHGGPGCEANRRAEPIASAAVQARYELAVGRDQERCTRASAKTSCSRRRRFEERAQPAA